MTEQVFDPIDDGTSFIYQGDVVSVGSANAKMIPALQPGVWKLKLAGEKGTALSLGKQSGEVFSLPEKLFGDVEKNLDIITQAYEAQNGSLGVLLNGEPGSGKTVLMSAIALYGLRNDIPVIIISDKESLQEMFALLDGEIGRAIILMDEFEKVFDEISDQNALLPFFDGAEKRNFLFVLCTNSLQMMDKTLLARPGRIRYKFNYTKLGATELQEVVDYFIKDEATRKDVLRVASSLKDVSYDNVITMCREVERRKISPEVSARELGLDLKWFIADPTDPKVNIEAYLYKDGDYENAIDVSLVVKFDIEEITHDLESDHSHGGFSAELDKSSPLYGTHFDKEDMIAGKYEPHRIKELTHEYLDLKVAYTENGAVRKKGFVRIYRNGVF